MFRSLADAIAAAESRGASLSDVALDAEAKDQGRDRASIRAALERALRVMRGAVTRGMEGDLHSASGLVGAMPPRYEPAMLVRSRTHHFMTSWRAHSRCRK